MADVELLDLGDRGHRLHVAVGEAVPRMDGEPGSLGEVGSLLKTLEGGVRVAVLVGILPGVEFHCLHTQLGGPLDAGLVRVNEQAHSHAGAPQRGNGVLQPRVWPARVDREVEPPFGGDLLPAFGDECRLMRLEIGCELHNVVGGGQFQVQMGCNRGVHPHHVIVQNVTSILP